MAFAKFFEAAVEAPLKSFSNHLKPALARRVRVPRGSGDLEKLWQFPMRMADFSLQIIDQEFRYMQKS